MSQRMAGISLAHSSLEAYVSNANNTVFFKMIREESDLEDEGSYFNPEYTHQIFGESESIFGYTDLRVDLFYSASNLLMYFGMTYSDRANPQRTGGVQPDDVLKTVSEKLEVDFVTNIDVFAASLQKEVSFKPYGELINSFSPEDKTLSNQTFQVYRADMSVPGFRAYHQRMQTFILFFIDAASYIDVDDERWEYFIIYERVRNSGDFNYYFIGYATAYRYYAYPTKVRPRISQMFILPTLQKKGLGAEMLQTICNWYIRDSEVLDITVEDPSQNFIRLRDYIDCRNCMHLPSFHPTKLVKGLSEEMLCDAQEKLKIGRRQTRRVYEILRLNITNVSNEQEYKAYRIDVKSRLNAPFQRQKLDMEKLSKTLSPDELKSTLNCSNPDQRIEQLDHMYKDLESEYRQVLKRLSA